MTVVRRISDAQRLFWLLAAELAYWPLQRAGDAQDQIARVLWWNA